MKFRKKPVIVEAVQIQQNKELELLDFLHRYKIPYEVVGSYHFVFLTPEGEIGARINDWVIYEGENTIRIMKHQLFLAAYEPVKDK